VTDPLFSSQRRRIVELAARHRIPAAYWSRVFPEAGGLDVHAFMDRQSITSAFTSRRSPGRGAQRGVLRRGQHFQVK
jgi:hypothetical protein